MPAEAEDVYFRHYNDYSPRLLVLTSAEAWALPTISGKADANPGSVHPHRLNWVSLADTGISPTMLSSNIAVNSWRLCMRVESAAASRWLPNRSHAGDFGH
jgi:hypothetical protein